MRPCLLISVAVGVLCAGCRSPQFDSSPTPQLALDVASWRARSPDGVGVREYAAHLTRLNPGKRAPFDASDGISLAEAEAVALLFNPSLRVARLKARVPKVGAQHAGIREDPRVELDLLRILEGVSSPWILASGVKFTIPLTGHLARERELALADADVAMRAALVAEWDLVVRLREEWSKWSAMHERAALIEAHLASVNEVHGIAKAQGAARQISVPQVRVLELESVARTGDLQALRGEMQAQLLALRALMGLTPYAEVLLVPDLGVDPIQTDRVQDELALQQESLELALAKAEFVQADRNLRLEVSKRYPDMELGPLLESEEGIARLGAGVGFTLPLWNRNRRAIVEACATREVARAAYQARHQELVARLARSRAELTALSLRRAWLTDKVAPLADRQLADVRRLGELGDMDVLILKDALTSVLDAKIKLLDLRLERVLASNRRRALVEPILTPSTSPLSR